MVTGAIVRRLQNLGVRVVAPWPASGIENVWSMLGQRLQNHHATTEAGLWHALQESWNAIPQQHIKNCVRSMPARLQEVIAARGRPTHY